MARPDAAEWQKAIDKEMNSLRDMGTLKFVSMQEFWNQKKRNPKLTLLPSSLLLKTKYKDDGAGNSIEDCKKARIVACGNRQVYGVHYEQIFAPGQ